MLLSAELRGRLDRLSLVGRRRVRALWAGSHASTRKGESLDFSDYRPYVAGDDFRRIDHNLWARLGQVLIRQYEAEEELPVRLVIDVSSSMSFDHKFETARELAGMVAYLGLVGGDRIQPTAIPGREGRSLSPGPSGRHLSAWPALEAWLESLTPAGPAPLSAAVRSVIGGASTRGPVVLISDLLDPDWPRALDSLSVAAGGLVLHVLATGELDPRMTGDLRLVDSETGLHVDVSSSAESMQRYRSALEAFVSGAAGRARRAGMDYLLVEARPGAGLEALDALVNAGAIR
ncbi:MAG: DUF58 domain-containing protein [Acidimicrobiia bacterium]